MSRKLLGLAVIPALAMAWASAAKADLITIGLQAPTVNGDTITVEDTSTVGDMFWSTIPYGTFSQTTGSSVDTMHLGLPTILDSNTIDTSSIAAGVLTIYVTASDQTSLSGTTNWLTGFTAQNFPAGWSITEQTYLDPDNGIYNVTDTGLASSAVLLQTHTFTSGGSDLGLPNTYPDLPPTWSVSEVYTITATSAGSTNDTIDLTSTVPEPASMSLLGGGLVAFGVWRRRRSQKA